MLGQRRLVAASKPLRRRYPSFRCVTVTAHVAVPLALGSRPRCAARLGRCGGRRGRSRGPPAQPLRVERDDSRTRITSFEWRLEGAPDVVRECGRHCHSARLDGGVPRFGAQAGGVVDRMPACPRVGRKGPARVVFPEARRHSPEKSPAPGRGGAERETNPAAHHSLASAPPQTSDAPPRHGSVDCPALAGVENGIDLLTFEEEYTASVGP